MKSVLITGGTGFIGGALSLHLQQKDWDVWVLTRRKPDFVVQESTRLHFISKLSDIPESQTIDAIVNLAGEPLNSHRWSKIQKQTIIDSRLHITESLANWLETQNRTVETWINGSAIGWYGPQDSQILDESSIAVDGFSHSLCEQWEQAALAGSKHCKRLIRMRTGIVLDGDGGPLKEMLLPYRFGLGGRMGDGKQYWSWIQREDIVRLMAQMLCNNSYTGIVNATAPNPVTQAEFSRTLAKELGRPCLGNLPAWVYRLALGEFAIEVLCQSQRVMPQQAMKNGFKFSYPSLSQALRVSLA